jgi:hypothetical protein
VNVGCHRKSGENPRRDRQEFYLTSARLYQGSSVAGRSYFESILPKFVID